jgi:hypothetical protein
VIDASIMITTIILIFEPKSGKIITDSIKNQFTIPSALLFIGEFSGLFQMQIYFLQVMQYTSSKR